MSGLLAITWVLGVESTWVSVFRPSHLFARPDQKIAHNWAETEFWYFCVFVNLLVWICVLLCAYLFLFYEFLPSRIMVAKTTRLVTRAQYRSVVNVLDNARHTAEELPWLHILDDRIVNFKPNLLRVQMQIVLQERRMFSGLPYLLRWGGRIISSLGSKIPPQNQKGWIVLIAQCEKLIQQFYVFGKIYHRS